MLGVISWIVCGLIVGLIARAIVPGRQPIGMLMTIVLGVAGAFIGGLISTAIWGQPPSDPATAEVATMWPGWLMSIVGGILLLWGYVALAGRSDAAIPTRV
jgi:uncharacterized membrane protein YeaQ/YmgE (transglycosylase-associated protein family)